MMHATWSRRSRPAGPTGEETCDVIGDVPGTDIKLLNTDGATWKNVDSGNLRGNLLAVIGATAAHR